MATPSTPSKQNPFDAIIQTFQSWDVNGDGGVDPSELAFVLRALDCRYWTDDRIYKLLMAADGNRNGKIELEEFVRWVFSEGQDQRAFRATFESGMESPHGTPDDLHEACLNGDLATVRKLVKSGVNVEARYSKNHDKPLHSACKHNYLDIARYLIEQVAVDRNSSGEYDHNALHISCQSGYVELTEYLIAAGVNCNKKRLFSSFTPMILAIYGNHVIVVECLLRGRADTEIQGQYGTALHSACRTTYARVQQKANAIIRLLIEWKANKECRTLDGYTPLMVAAEGGDRSTVELLIRSGCNARARNIQGRLPWQIAQENHPQLASMLEPRHEDFARTMPLTVTTLLEASRNGELVVVQHLINNKMSPEVSEQPKGDRPLHAACKHNNLDVVRYLLETIKVERNSRGDSDHNALHISCSYGHIELTEYLIHAGVNMNRRRMYSALTPLMLAIYGNHVAIVRCLIHYRVDLEVQGQWGTALHIAAKGAGYKRDPHKGNAIIRLLIEAGANREARDMEGYTPYLLAVGCRDQLTANVLIQLGCNPYAQRCAMSVQGGGG